MKPAAPSQVPLESHVEPVLEPAVGLAAAQRPSMPLYKQIAEHYRSTMVSGALRPGDRMPSVRAMMRQHAVSLSTALQVCRYLEREGWLEAKARSGYFVRRATAVALPASSEPDAMRVDPAQYVGVHAGISAIINRQHQFPDALNLGGATAAPELYPTQLLKNSALRALRHAPELLTTYGSHHGNLAFRRVLARRALTAGIHVAPEDVIVTHGGIEAVNLALRAVAQPGDVVAVESPTFFGLLQILESLGMRALEIPTSPTTGLSLEALALAIETYSNIKAVVVVPNLQNPLGSIMPDAHKGQLIQLCAQHGIAVIEDDPYRELSDRATPLKAAKAWDEEGNVIYCASLNKTLAPGMRLGWMAAGRWLERVRMLKFAQSRHNEEWPQIVAADFMGSPAYDRHLARLREQLRQQRERTADAIAAYFPSGTRMTRPDGGLLLWVELPGQIDTQVVFEQALTLGIRIAPGAMFSNSNRYARFLRISCGAPYTAELDHALRKLGQMIGALSL